MKTIITVIILTTLISITYPQIQRQKFHPLSGTISVGMDLGASLGITDYQRKKVDMLTRFSAEYFIPTYNNTIFGIKLFTDIGSIKGIDDRYQPNLFRTDVVSITGGITYGYQLNNYIFPYIFGGIGLLNFNPKDEYGNPLPNNARKSYKRNDYNIVIQPGFKFAVTENMCLTLNATLNLCPNDNLDDIITGANNDFYYAFMAGISYAFGGEKDDDGDGVPNSIDKCPNTPMGVKVDEFGCPMDHDKDGVPDYLDKCPNTPSGVKVDANGCPLDSDRDGVPDYLDLCPNTPMGILVDENGCPVDSDQDGVPDYLDKCPKTPFGVEVDANGCPKDTDRDGVPDYLDKCPDTKPGEQVDANGCPKVVEVPKDTPKIEPPSTNVVVKKEYLIKGTNFAFNSAEILPSGMAELDSFIKVLKQDPVSRWRIEGYTDNVGKDEGNRIISERRAQSVLKYLMSKGVDPNRFDVKGFGKANPIGDNKTEEGRAKNRRVRIIRVN